MKILFVLTPAFNPNAGGVQRTTYKLGKYFTEKGFSVSYYSFSDTGHVKVEYGSLHHAIHKGKNKNNLNIEKLCQVLKEFIPDIVINQMPYEVEIRDALHDYKKKLGFHLLGCLRNSLFSVKNNLEDTLLRSVPKKLSLFLNNSLGRRVFLEIHKIKHSSYLKAILDKNDYFILLAPPNLEEVNYFIGNYKSEKIISIPNSIPFVDEKPTTKEKIILYVGRLDIAQKRSDLLLSFWERTYSHLPDWTFVIVGDGVYKKKIEEDIIKKNIPRVRIEGYQVPEPYYEKASIFVMTSAFEGFPNVILEAQSYGVVPVAFESYGVLRWIVNDSQDAFLIPPFDCEAMAKQVIDLAKDNNKLILMNNKSKKNAARFTIDQVGQMWIDFFDKKLKIKI